VRATVHGDAAGRLVNLDGAVVAEGSPEVAAPVGALSDVFLLDLDGRNRYVMTTADTLAALLELPQARVEVEVSDAALPLPRSEQVNCTLTFRNTGSVAALGIVLESREPAYFSDNVLDLLPGEERRIVVEGSAQVAFAGWNCAG
jgi:hypothetical protein